MNIIGIIPARMSSSRFPGKPLASICGIPMIGHVYLRSKICKELNDIYIATCDKEIAEYSSKIGAKAIMTADTHQRASDRTAEALLKIEKKIKKKVDIVVMIQGDEPLIYPEMLKKSIIPIINGDALVVNLMAPLKSKEEQNDPNEVKVTFDLNNFALYFSREPIPSWKKGAKNVPMFKQVCIIPFTRDFLIKFNDLTSTPLEVIESVDMLRVLEHGYRVKMVKTDFSTYSVDTQKDLQFVENCMKSDPLFEKYRR